MRAAAIVAAVSAIACAASVFAQESTATVVYESVAPAVVFVETDGGSGSGLLLASNSVLTAAHVVYPHRSARVVFPSGTHMLDVPVIGWDLMADVAVLGPISDATLEPPPLGFPDGLPVGAELFVIGYPGEEEPFPQPAISRTVLSRHRRPLMALTDDDDGVALNVHARHAGAIDHPYDVDTYLLSLQAGDTVRVRVDSVLIDPYLRIDYRGSSDVAEDDDSGGGLFGRNAELVYRAEEDRTYRIVVDDPTGQYGGYALTVRRHVGRG